MWLCSPFEGGGAIRCGRRPWLSSPPPFSPMELQSLTFALFIPLLLFFKLLLAVDPFASSPLMSPSPGPTYPTLFAPSPPPKNHAPKIAVNDDGGQQRSKRTSSAGRLNLGEKVGLSFLAVAVGLQVVLGGLLVCTRIQSRRMERGDLLTTELMRPCSPWPFEWYRRTKVRGLLIWMI